MSIAIFESRIWDPAKRNFLNSESKHVAEQRLGVEFLSIQIGGILRIVEVAAGTPYRDMARLEFADDAVRREWILAEQRAISIAGGMSNMIYRIRPDDEGPLDLCFADYTSYDRLESGMPGVIIGSLMSRTAVNA